MRSSSLLLFYDTGTATYNAVQQYGDLIMDINLGFRVFPLLNDYTTHSLPITQEVLVTLQLVP
jgi:hypothetical protein